MANIIVWIVGTVIDVSTIMMFCGRWGGGEDMDCN